MGITSNLNGVSDHMVKSETDIEKIFDGSDENFTGFTAGDNINKLFLLIHLF